MLFGGLFCLCVFLRVCVLLSVVLLFVGFARCFACSCVSCLWFIICCACLSLYIDGAIVLVINCFCCLLLLFVVVVLLCVFMCVLVCVLFVLLFVVCWCCEFHVFRSLFLFMRVCCVCFIVCCLVVCVYCLFVC